MHLILNSLIFDDDKVALSILQELVDRMSFRIVLSVIDRARNATQIASENQLPLSSTYKKIRKLQAIGIVSIERIDIDDSGKRILYYRSRIKSVEFNATINGVLLQFERNDHARSK